MPSVYSLRTLSETAARAAYYWTGRGATGEGDRGAVRAMINEMEQISLSCNVVVGDGVDENGRTLNPGSTFGKGDVADNMKCQLLTTYHSLAKAA